MTGSYAASIPSPVGNIRAYSNGVAVTGLFLDGHSQKKCEGNSDFAELPLYANLVTQLEEYFAGERYSFSLPLEFDGTPFQQLVWSALQDIAFGECCSYGELARRIGKPQASRAVGVANSRNPISIIVPCHRVIGSSGKLVGYAGGIERKEWLLAHEAQWSSQGSEKRRVFA